MSAKPTISKVLDRVNLVVFQTRIVSPVRDTGEGERDGSRIKKVLQSCFDPIVLRPLGRKKQEAHRLCRSFGTNVESLNAWAVPTERTALLTEKLAQIESEWSALAEELAINITAKVEAYASQNPAEAAAIRQLAPTASDVRNTTRFLFTSFRLRGEDVEDNGCLEKDLSGLAGQTLREFAVALRDASLDKGSGMQYTQGVKEVLGRVATKARSLAFLNPVLDEVANVLRETIDALPVSGLITNSSAILVRTVVEQMLDPARLLKMGFSKIAQVESGVNTVSPAGVPLPADPPKLEAPPKSVASPAPANDAPTPVTTAIPAMAYCI